MILKKLIGDNISIVIEDNLLPDVAVDKMCEKLLDSGVIKPSYVEAIKRLQHEIGPYYVVAPRIAMPHARPEDGVVKEGLQLTVFKHGVDLGDKDNGNVYLALTLAATGAENHMQLIQAVANFFQDETRITNIMHCDDIEQIKHHLT
ncbi:hypothetical protein A6A19_01060 [Actinobacillus delphinicola]|uniref:Putative PTS IIA-like nitrogen-regulatory protein PtsN n=1 Tax=Actinobacillus delphinicola TaxID=51161 RepID=A0A448TVU4_9PAST|nr:PTS sugar transporter subunit IIA [Actinobacillus delphinicola]MDG6896618.1 hypothetical protein [Actinobacillus delphinicola]VEJ10051.1 putative PTS IIA-like nitrogen-regulatory protein PtsN [Actinobacillus delphinicola]